MPLFLASLHIRTEAPQTCSKSFLRFCFLGIPDHIQSVACTGTRVQELFHPQLKSSPCQPTLNQVKAGTEQKSLLICEQSCLDIFSNLKRIPNVTRGRGISLYSWFVHRSFSTMKCLNELLLSLSGLPPTPHPLLSQFMPPCHSE